MAYFFVAIGFVLLFAGSQCLVRGGASLARLFGVPPILIGLLIVSTGTAAPALSIMLSGLWHGATEAATAAIVGANIFNLLLVLGLAALVQPLPTAPKIVFRDGIALVLASAAFMIMAKDGQIGQSDAYILLTGFVLFLVLSFIMDWRRSDRQCVFATRGAAQAPLSPGPTLLLLTLAAIFLFFGPILLVRGALALGSAQHIPAETMGLSVVAVAIAMPSLFMTMTALSRGAGGQAASNILVANIFNILGVVGLTAALHPIAITAALAGADIPIMAAGAALVVTLLNCGWKLNRLEGLALLVCYCAYLAFLAFRLDLLAPTLIALH